MKYKNLYYNLNDGKYYKRLYKTANILGKSFKTILTGETQYISYWQPVKKILWFLINDGNLIQCDDNLFVSVTRYGETPNKT